MSELTRSHIQSLLSLPHKLLVLLHEVHISQRYVELSLDVQAADQQLPRHPPHQEQSSGAADINSLDSVARIISEGIEGADPPEGWPVLMIQETVCVSEVISGEVSPGVQTRQH